MIVKKYQQLIHKEEEPASDTSDEHFQFRITDDQNTKLKKRRAQERKEKARQKQMSDRERIAIHRSRFGGCGVFNKKPDPGDEDFDFEATNNLKEELE